MGDSKIEWTDATWNPIRGCSMAPGSEAGGCLNCYAARMAARDLPGHRSPTTGKPFAAMRASGPRWTGEVELIPAKLAEPPSWRTPRRIFVNSMSDLFHEQLSDEAICKVFDVIRACTTAEAAVWPETHTFQILTKRPDRMLDVMRRLRFDGSGEGRVWLAKAPETRGGYALMGGLPGCAPLPNVWLGVSVENQATADARIPVLLKCPAAVRFVSYEPALGPVDFSNLSRHGERWTLMHDALTGFRATSPNGGVAEARIDWLIVGGESGPGARPFDIEWARSAVAQCGAAGVPCFVKQLGKWVAASAYGERPFVAAQWLFPDGSHFTPPLIGPRAHERPEGAVAFSLCDSKGGNMEEWPEDLRIREFPEVAHA